MHRFRKISFCRWLGQSHHALLHLQSTVTETKINKLCWKRMDLHVKHCPVESDNTTCYYPPVRSQQIACHKNANVSYMEMYFTGEGLILTMWLRRGGGRKVIKFKIWVRLKMQEDCLSAWFLFALPCSSQSAYTLNHCPTPAVTQCGKPSVIYTPTF